jgi:hypothetical protein
MASTPPVAHIRVNQVGYTSSQTEKHAVILSNVLLGNATCAVADANGSPVCTVPVGKRFEKWSAEFPYTYRVDFSQVTTKGQYVVKLTGPVQAESPVFRIDTGANLYGSLLSNTLGFYQTQRDGPDQSASSPLVRVASHIEDEAAYVYSSPNYSNDVLHGSPVRLNDYAPVDVSGGWFDAGDYLKFVQTASYATAIMLVGVRDYPEILGSEGIADFAAEGRFGLEWLLKMWDDDTRTLYYQVGIGDGNDSIQGDHDWWRLPEEDDALPIDRSAVSNLRYYIKYRPVFLAGPSGSQVSPNLAGRLAASFALGYQVFKSDDPAFAAKCLLAAQHVFDLADTHEVKTLRTASPHDYYPEAEWRDDMELGAAELYRAMAMGGISENSFDPSHYLELSAHWAGAYMNSSNDGDEFLGLYDVAALAHRELYLAMQQAGVSASSDVSVQDLLGDASRKLNRAVKQAAKDPFGLGMEYTRWELAPNALGLALEASFYFEMSQASTYAGLSQDQTDFLLGGNAWGTSFVVGAGKTWPHCIHHQIANLSGSLDGTPPVLLGATVAGPVPRTAIKHFEDWDMDGMQFCGGSTFDDFSGQGARYVDDVRSWPTVEPALDYTALTILLFARLASGL